ncbi:MAG: putative bifunctional diguanylate cyclase/phosphodiesterase, partial [Acetivibrio ethanolgignens]
ERNNHTTELNQSFDFRTWLKKHLFFILGILGFFAAATLFVLHRKEVYYRQLVMKDDLTGVWNRNKFIKEAERLLNHNKNKEYYLISTDVDKFNYINDTFGYSTGDEVLREEADQFARIFENQGIYARIAADEFVGIVENDGIECEKLLTRKLQEFEANMHEYSNHYFRLQIKIGICKIERRDSEARITEYIDRTNIAKKQIKGNLNQIIAYFDDETAKRSALENEIESKMEKALENGEFCVYYQPKYNLQTEVIEGAEALVRWIDPDKGMIGPDLFIPLFEKNGFIIRLDFYVYEEVCRHLQKWIKEGRRVVPVSVNVSRAHLGTPNFIPDMIALLKKYEIPVKLVELELTESVFSDDEETMKRIVMTLKNIGFRISIDDFGSGYSSLNLLKQIPADVLKIDRGFLEEVEESIKSKIIIAQVVSMARKINMHTVCEGVETKKQADFLREIHCEVAQGYLFSKPLPLPEFESKITGQS